jgi:hypothetical protein
LSLAIQGLACGYYGIFGGLAVAWGILWFGIARGHARRWRYWALATGAAAVTALVVYPFLSPVLEIREAGFGRTLDDARLFAARWPDYLASPMLVHSWMLPLIGQWREVLFPGFLGIGLTFVAAARAFRPRPSGGGGVSRSVLGFYVSVAALAMWASFGPDGGLYRVLYDTLPFFSLIRASARFGVLVTLAVSVIAGAALAALARSTSGRRRLGLVGCLMAAALVRSTAGPLPLVDRPVPHVVYERLAQLPMGPVAEFPYFSAARDRHRHTEYMLASTLHWQPLINGYSDHTPADAFADAPVLETFPSADAWAVLERRGARYVVMHWNMYQSGTSPHVEVRRALVGRYLRTIVDLDDASLFEIVDWP